MKLLPVYITFLFISSPILCADKEQVQATQRILNLICNHMSCNKSFTNQFDLARHQHDIHGAKIDYEKLNGRENKLALFCKMCNVTIGDAKEQAELEYHLENAHAFCKVCDKPCPQKEGKSNSQILFDHYTATHYSEIEPIASEE